MADRMTMTTITTPGDTAARENWQRYLYGKDRGGTWTTCRMPRAARTCTWAGAEQWPAAVRAQLEREGRPAIEFHEIKPSINSAIGYRIQNRMDIAFKPRGGEADLDKANDPVQGGHAGGRSVQSALARDAGVQRRRDPAARLTSTCACALTTTSRARLGTLDPLDVIPDPTPELRPRQMG